MTTECAVEQNPRASSGVAASRAAVYDLLAALYLSAPSAEVVDGLLGVAGVRGPGGLPEGPASECLGRFAATYDGDPAPLRQEFDDLFVVPLGRYVTPYEAVYRDERIVGETRVSGLLMGPSTIEVLSAYRELGLAVPPECSELPDHVGIELSFMARLCAREDELDETGDGDTAAALRRRQLHFLDRHLLQWFPELAGRIQRNASSEFYRGVALLTHEFLEADALTLAEMTGEF